ncbi:MULTISPECIES: ABC transporter substrate-binding protein [unclassified Leptolyngbya]|uniref:ABC transporter substrate-binding protein n=1 Tax=unclassified Leptolyngbya TaxID=2650499 RepID=UPI0016888295|nr:MULTISPECIES: ABC transporter substrate-binding protein [unclassified Leptolyngbya]MBD1913367.1 carbohydrate ABC transporter substrate-binding protein [Leptolyngbya sp. FACHB-8]MBD2158702.1 carbohydrate ABC transporter substrate-binding protein [Leptolyngbya sp. FACHB-16]
MQIIHPIIKHFVVKKPYKFLLASLLSFIVIACTQAQQVEVTPQASPSTADAPLTIWWEKGFNLEEDEALQAVVADWGKKTGNPVELIFHTTDDFPQKTERALQSGNPPDIVMSHNAERGLYPRLGWEGKLVDVTDVVETVRSLYPDSIMEAVQFYNNAEKKRSYYAVPFSQSSNFISYWRDMVKQAGYTDADIPQDWDGFWNFWKELGAKLPQDPKTYGLGFSFSDKAGDTYYLFEQVLEAYDVQILTPDGELKISDPAVQEGILNSLKWYTQFFKDGVVPPDTVNWLNPDNNTVFLNRQVAMTPNTSLTIPATARQDPEVYQNKLGTMSFPSKPNGKPMRNILTIKQAVIFKGSRHEAIAKQFLTDFVQPATINNYLKAAGLRNMPIAKPLWDDPYWTNPNDPHIAAGAKVLTSPNTRPFPSVYHPAYSVVTKENVWGKAIHRIVADGVAPEKAAEDAIAEVQKIFNEWT